MIRIFYAHPSTESPKQIKEDTKRLTELIGERFQSQGGTLPKIAVIPGRRDFQSFYRGDWSDWAKSVVERVDSMTRKQAYAFFVIQTETCGRATANIIQFALAKKRQVFWWDGDSTLVRVEKIEVSDPENWSSGFNIIKDPVVHERPKIVEKSLSKERYQIIYVDPPWDYKGQLQHNGKGGKDTGGAIAHYKTLTLSELKELDILSIADDSCLLFLWSTSPHLDQAIELLKSWGFKWATIGFVWDKQKVNPGFYTMSQCEICLIGKRGKIPQPRGARNIRQLVSSLREKHSKKPDEVRNRIEQMFPTQKKIELFARERNDGWDVWGDEVQVTPESEPEDQTTEVPFQVPF